MKLLIFEYLTGGGCNRQDLPDSLLREGRMMLDALLANVAELNGVEPVVMLDSRLFDPFDTRRFTPVVIGPDHDSHAEFARLAEQCDAAWPVAPEFDGILHALCAAVGANTQLLTPPAAAVALTGNKYLTYRRLLQHGVPTVPTELLSDAVFQPGAWVVKPIDGAGCADNFVVADPASFAEAQAANGSAIIQQQLTGATESLSCLFKHGCGWLVAVNRQHCRLIDRHYRLTGLTVNAKPDNDGRYQRLACAVAAACPELWGYAGIDLIEADGQLNVLEINPRLTTSFAGLQAALGINVAEQVLRLSHGEPELTPLCNRAVRIDIA